MMTIFGDLKGLEQREGYLYSLGTTARVLPVLVS